MARPDPIPFNDRGRNFQRGHLNNDISYRIPHQGALGIISRFISTSIFLLVVFFIIVSCFRWVFHKLVLCFNHFSTFFSSLKNNNLNFIDNLINKL